MSGSSGSGSMDHPGTAGNNSRRTENRRRGRWFVITQHPADTEARAMPFMLPFTIACSS